MELLSTLFKKHYLKAIPGHFFIYLIFVLPLFV